MSAAVKVAGIALVGAFALSACVSGEGSDSSSGDESSTRLGLDYAYYNPLSLVVRDQECVENKGYEVDWILSAGSNKANENLNAEALDIGSTAGAAALLARSNGAAIKTIGVFTQPEWAAVVVTADSPINAVSELKGKKVAATKGTDPYFFLLQALRANGLTEADVEIINLQHADGYAALARGDVDAWAGLDPIMATTEINEGARLIYRNVDFNSYGVLNAREKFIEESPEAIDDVLACYQEARQWILDNPTEAAAILAEEASLDQNIASKVLTERTVVDLPLAPGPGLNEVLETILPTLVAEGQVRSEEEATEALSTLFDTSFAERAGK